MPQIARIDVPDLPEPVGPYRHAVRHGDTLYTSGFTAFGTDAQNGDAGAQTRAVFDQLKTVAESQGSSMEKLIKVTIFITDPADIPEFREAVEAIYGAHRPASSLLVIGGLFDPGLRIEVEAIFAI